MPRCCNVRGCKSNYKSQKESFTTFAIPKTEPLRSQWIRSIPTNLSGLKNPVICIKHFDESQIIRTDTCIVSGVYKVFQRQIPKLKEGSLPSIFPNLEKCTVLNTKRHLPDVETSDLEKEIKLSMIDQLGRNPFKDAVDLHAPAIRSEVVQKKKRVSNKSPVKGTENSVPTVVVGGPVSSTTSSFSSNEADLSSSVEITLTEAALPESACHSRTLCSTTSQEIQSQLSGLLTDEHEENDVIELILLKIEAYERKLEKLGEMNDRYCRKINVLTQKSQEMEISIEHLKSAIDEFKYTGNGKDFPDSECKFANSDIESAHCGTIQSEAVINIKHECLVDD